MLREYIYLKDRIIIIIIIIIITFSLKLDLIISKNVEKKNASFGKNGIIAAGRKQLIIANSSTISPEQSKYCADRLRQKQIDFIAMPVMGGPMAAKKAN